MNSMIVEAVYDLGVRLDNKNMGTEESWNKADEFLNMVKELFDLKDYSAGTGFGIRDMQLGDDPKRPDMTELIKYLAKRHEVNLEYVHRCFLLKDQDERYCPVCRNELDYLQDIEQIEGTIGNDKVFTYLVHYECLTCPDVFQVTISIPGEEPCT